MLILASQSPRRREILAKLGLDFEVCPSNTEEKAPAGLPPEEYVMALAQQKGLSVSESHPGDTVISADTIVWLDGKILGKPKNQQEAHDMLAALSGREHTVYTGVTVCHDGKVHTFCESTLVRFRKLSEGLIGRYIASGEPMDKAGAYGIQGIGGTFVRGIEGDFFNVMGLPLCALTMLLEELGVAGGER